MKAMSLAALLALAAGLVAVFARPGDGPAPQARPETPAPEGAETLVLAGGCFWCVEAIYEDLRGVHSVESGYAGGSKPGLTYREVSSGASGAAEVVKVTFDPKVLPARDVLRIFFTVHDPTTLNRQGNDVGPQYRSAVFYADDAQKALAQEVIDEVTKEKLWPDPLVTTLEPLANYTKAEDYHQDYFRKFETGTAVERAGMNAGYCQVVVEPKVRKFRQKYAARLKSNGG